MKLLIAVDKSRQIYLKPFTEKLLKYNIETKIIDDLKIYEPKKDKKILRWLKTPSKFNDLISDFNPDIVFTERTSHFCSLLSKHNIPFIIFLRGNYWFEYNIAKNKTKSLKKVIELKIKHKIATDCFNSSLAIMPICNHLNKIVKKFHPKKNTHPFYQGIDIENWQKNDDSQLKLKHPCIGFLQGAKIYEKAKEMKILSKVIESFPNITFYWAGDGPYKDEILSVLGNYKNFEWLGHLDYPNKVKEFLSEIDIYGLCTGLDMSPHTILEAGILEKPTIATNVGGVSESIIDKETGFLVELNNPDDWIEKIGILINDVDKMKQMGVKANMFVRENFSWEKIAFDFSKIVEKYL